MSGIILGIDPGIGRTGYAFLLRVNSQEWELIDYGCLTTRPGLEIPLRLSRLYSSLSKLIVRYKPGVMVLEKLFFNTNSKTAIVVGQACGVIMLSGARAGLDVKELTPLQVKTGLTGYGRADKAQVQKMVMATLGLRKKPTPDDASDAIAVALSYSLRNSDLE